MKMTHRERLIAAARGEETDIVPVSPRMGYPLIKKFGSASLDAHMKFQQEYDYDITYITTSGLPNIIDSIGDRGSYSLTDASLEVKTFNDGELQVIERSFHTPAGILRDVKKVAPSGREYGLNPNPIHIEPLIKDRSDLLKLPYITPDPRKFCDIDAVKKLEHTLGDRGIIQVMIRGPLDHQAADARGMENFMIDYHEDREFFNEIIGFFMKHILEETKICLENGIENIFGSWYYTSLSAGWSPEIFKEVFFPLMKKHVDLVHEYNGIYDLYDDGKMMKVLELYKDTGTDILETLTPPPVGDFDLRKAKALIGDKVCLKGYVDLIYVVKEGDEALIRDTIFEALDIASPGGRFILGNSDSFREKTPWENIEAYFKYARMRR